MLGFDEYLGRVADVVRIKSKDPSSKTGAIIVDPENQVVSTGFNGFPRGIDETDPTRWERPVKYQYIVHAEANAVYTAARKGISLQGCIMYMVAFGPPTVPCTECTKAIIQSGIVRVVGCAYKKIDKTWVANMSFAKNLLDEAGVEVEEITYVPVRY